MRLKPRTGGGGIHNGQSPLQRLVMISRHLGNDEGPVIKSNPVSADFNINAHTVNIACLPALAIILFSKVQISSSSQMCTDLMQVAIS